MAELKNIGVRDFRDHATAYLSGPDPVAVSKHGRVIGFYIPVERDDEEIARALDRLSGSVGRVVGESGLSEDALADALDLRQRTPAS